MLKDELRDFPGGPVASTPCFQCKRSAFDFWSGNQNPYTATKSSCATTRTQGSQINKNKFKDGLRVDKNANTGFSLLYIFFRFCQKQRRQYNSSITPR